MMIGPSPSRCFLPLLPFLPFLPFFSLLSEPAKFLCLSRRALRSSGLSAQRLVGPAACRPSDLPGPSAGAGPVALGTRRGRDSRQLRLPLHAPRRVDHRCLGRPSRHLPPVARSLYRLRSTVFSQQHTSVPTPIP